jgi:hypothetical protein
MLFKWRIKKYDYNGQIYYMPQRKGWIFWNNATWDEYRKLYYEEADHYFSTCSKLEVPGLVDYVAFANLEDAKRLIEGIEKQEARKKKFEKELDEYIYIDDDSLSKELKK